MLHGCWGVIDKSKNKPVTNVSETALYGEWKADKFSYEYNFDREEDTIKLRLNSNGSFLLRNGLLMENDTVLQRDFQGKWKLERRAQKGHTDQYQIRFYSSEGSKKLPTYLEVGFPLYDNGNKFQIYLFTGDPDMGDRIGLYKTKSMDNPN